MAFAFFFFCNTYLMPTVLFRFKITFLFLEKFEFERGDFFVSSIIRIPCRLFFSKTKRLCVFNGKILKKLWW